MFSRLVMLLLALYVPLSWGAASATALKWNDLRPDDPALRATLTKLPPEQMSRLLRAMRQDELKALLKKGGPAAHQRFAENSDKLLKEDFSDLKPLLSTVEAFNKRLAGETMERLNGKQVQLDGYLLPLQQKDKKVTEFLLVPVVGACIHVPPPPPNQMVSVTYPAGYKPSGLYDAVTIRGTLRTQSSKPNLYLKDGSSGVNVSYAMSADEVLPFKKTASH